MTSLKKSLENALPESLVNSAKSIKDGIWRLKDWPAAAFHPYRRDSRRKLAAYKDIHKGERCFVIGNGPSLRKTDMTKLKNEYSFGMNRIFLSFEELNFRSTYFTCVNDLVVEQSAEEIRALGMPKFIAWRSHKWLGYQEDIHYLYTSYTGPHFAEDMRGRIWEGGTVTNVTIQLAAYMGFDPIILIGVDHNYSTKGEPNKTVVSEGDDPDHVHAKYFAKGFRWQLPDLDSSERAYAMARQHLESQGRTILDATVGGKLQIFQKVNYEDLF